MSKQPRQRSVPRRLDQAALLILTLACSACGRPETAPAPAPPDPAPAQAPEPATAPEPTVVPFTFSGRSRIDGSLFKTYASVDESGYRKLDRETKEDKEPVD